MHDLSLIATIAASFTAAWILGLFTQWLRLSPIVGYLLAGVLIGPHTPGFVGDIHIAQQLAEVGVILLMFGVGLHFHMKDLLAVKRIAIPGAVVQSLLATIAAMGIFSIFGMPLMTGAVLGMAMAVASTVVLMRVLMDANVMNSPQGHVAVGWLIVEDIFTVVLLVLIPVLGTNDETVNDSSSIAWTLLLAFIKLGILGTIVLWGGSRLVPWVLVRVARLRSRELFTLTVLVFSIAVAAASYFFFGASMALGAFLAGMVVAQSPVSSQAAADALPMRDAFAVIFFVSVGMLFDPAFLLQEPFMVAAALGIILLVKPLAALLIVAILGQSFRTALTVAIGLAQIGEFSFILSELARQHGLMPDAGHNVLVAAAIISITVNPLMFRSLPKVELWVRGHPRIWKLLNGRSERRLFATDKTSNSTLPVPESKRGHAIVVGYGPVGRSVHHVLKDAGISTVVIDYNVDTVSALKAEGQPAIFGDASNVAILVEAGVKEATHLVVTLPDASQRAAIVTAGRNMSTGLRIIVRARYLRERDELEQIGATSAVFEEAEGAIALARLVLSDTGLHREAADRKLKEIRLQLVMDNISTLGTQRIATVMVPWTRVRCLSSDASQQKVLSQIAQEKVTRWPVVDPKNGEPIGYLDIKDLIAFSNHEGWTHLVRPLQSLGPNDSIGAALTGMRNHHDTICLVRDQTTVYGIATLGHILEHVAGRLEDENTHDAPVSLVHAVTRGGIVNPLTSTSRDQAIRELVAALPLEKLNSTLSGEQISEMAIERENQISTDIGNGIAIPHARCPGLESPLVVIGQSREGVIYSGPESTPVHLIFLIITPAECPDTQLALLSQLARIARNESLRTALFKAVSPVDLLSLLDPN